MIESFTYANEFGWNKIVGYGGDIIWVVRDSWVFVVGFVLHVIGVCEFVERTGKNFEFWWVRCKKVRVF